MNTLSVGDNIRKCRKKKGWSQAKLGEKLNVSQQMIGQYENNKNPKIETIEKIAIALEVPLKDLLPDEFASELEDQEFTKACEYLDEAGFTVVQGEKDLERNVFQIIHPDHGTVTTETKEYILNLIQRVLNDSIAIQEKYIVKRLQIELLPEKK